MGTAVEAEPTNQFGPNAHATDYPPVFVVGRAPEHFESFRWSGNLYIVGQKHLPVPLGPGTAALHIDGAGVFEGRFCTTPTGFDGIDLDRDTLIRRFGDHARGAMALYVADSQRHELLLLPDQMSAAIVFVYRGPSVSACSTSLRALARVLRGMGISLTKSSEFFVEVLATEAGGHAPSSYDEIDTAPLHAYVTVSDRGISFSRYPGFVDLYQPGMNYEEQLAIAAEEIVENAALSATQTGTLTSHLTAGADSRLVGAALHAAGVDHKFVFYCAENAVTREQDIARRIAGHMNWTMTRHPGVSTAYKIPGVVYQRHAILEASEGLKAVGPTEGNLRVPGLVLTGYNGEAVRSFYSTRVESLTPGRYDADAHLQATWPKRIWDPEAGLVERAAIERTLHRIDSDLEGARELGIPTETLGDYLYFKSRNRYFAWHTAMEASRYLPQFTPLYSPAMVRLAMSMPMRDRRTGRIAFDLYRLLAPKALEIPFDTPKFEDEVHREWEALPLRAPEYLPEPKYDERKTPPAPEQYVTGQVPASTKEHVERARKITGVTAADLAAEERYREITRQLVLHKSTTMSGTLRKDRVRVLTNKPANTRAKVRMLSRLVAYLPWYTDSPHDSTAKSPDDTSP